MTISEQIRNNQDTKEMTRRAIQMLEFLGEDVTELKNEFSTIYGEELKMKLCPMCNSVTNCTENCKDCAREAYRDLKGMAGNAEFVSEEAIRNDLTDEAFELMRKYGFIECCGVLNGHKMYAI